MTGYVLCTTVNFDAGNDSRIGDDFNQGSAVLLLLADRFVVEDRATNALIETGRGHKQLPVSTPGLLGLGNPYPAKSFVAGWITLIRRQQAFVIVDQRPGSGYKFLQTHL